MVSKSQKKLIQSLHQKKYRKQHGLFVAEGKKTIKELLDAGMILSMLYTTEMVFEVEDQQKIVLVTPQELKQISFLTTPQLALAVFEIPQTSQPAMDGLVLALDDVRDPGNLGTIIRLCDWFGIATLICSKATVDCYNPKVVQATMGSITRVQIHYVDLEPFLKDNEAQFPIYGTFMNGSTIYQESLSQKGILVMGNEANGISPAIEALVHKRLTIPRFGVNQETESLNVATATAIVLNEFRRG